jgi:hypothetical protein
VASSTPPRTDARRLLEWVRHSDAIEDVPDKVVWLIDKVLDAAVLPADPLTGDPIRVTTAAISSYAKLLLERDEANAEVARLTAALRAVLLDPVYTVESARAIARAALAGATDTSPRPPADAVCLAGDFPHTHRYGPDGCLHSESVDGAGTDRPTDPPLKVHVRNVKRGVPLPSSPEDGAGE